MKKYVQYSVALAPLLMICGSALAQQTIANCAEPEGYAYYHHTAFVPKDKSGFQKDRITGGLTTLQKVAAGQYDILYVDVNKRITSYRGDGAVIQLYRKSEADATFLVFWPSRLALEAYTFYRDAGGANRFDLFQNRGGSAPIHKSSLLSGTCSELRLDLIEVNAEPRVR